MDYLLTVVGVGIKADESAVAKDEDGFEISKRLLAQNKEAYEMLAK